MRDHALVAPLPYEPVVVAPHAGTQRACFGGPAGTDPGPELGDWECVAAGWWSKPARPGPTARRVRARVRGSARRRDGAPTWPRRRLPAGAGDRRPPDRQRHPVPRLAHRRAGRGAHLVLPELGGARRATVRGGSARTSWSSCRRAHDVTLHFARSGAEKIGAAGTRRSGLAGLVALGHLATCSGAGGPRVRRTRNPAQSPRSERSGTTRAGAGPRRYHDRPAPRAVRSLEARSWAIRSTQFSRPMTSAASIRTRSTRASPRRSATPSSGSPARRRSSSATTCARRRCRSCKAFIEGATLAGADVVDVGLASTDLVYFAAGLARRARPRCSPPATTRRSTTGSSCAGPAPRRSGRPPG